MPPAGFRRAPPGRLGVTKLGCTSPAVHLAAPKSRGWLIIWGDDASKRYDLSYQPSVWWPWRGFLGQPRRGLSPSSGDKQCLVSLWSSSTGKADKERGRSRPWHPPTLTRGQRGKQHPPACPLGQFRCGFFFFFCIPARDPSPGPGRRPAALDHKRQSAAEPPPCQASTAAWPGPEPCSPPLLPPPQPPGDLQEPPWQQQHPKGGPSRSEARLENPPAR